MKAGKTQLELPDVGEVEGVHQKLSYLQTYKNKKETVINQKC